MDGSEDTVNETEEERRKRLQRERTARHRAQKKLEEEAAEEQQVRELEKERKRCHLTKEERNKNRRLKRRLANASKDMEQQGSPGLDQPVTYSSMGALETEKLQVLEQLSQNEREQTKRSSETLKYVTSVHERSTRKQVNTESSWLCECRNLTMPYLAKQKGLHP